MRSTRRRRREYRVDRLAGPGDLSVSLLPSLSVEVHVPARSPLAAEAVGVNGHVDLLACGHRRSSLVAIESPRV